MAGAGTLDLPKREGTSNNPTRAPTKAMPRSKGASEIQAIVDELVRTHGDNVCNWSDWPRMLADLGVNASQVSDKVVALARHNAKASREASLEAYYSKQRVPLPKAADFPDLLAWLKEVTRLRGFHPHTVATTRKLLDEGGVTADQFDDELLARATRETWPVFRVYAEAHNAKARADGRWTYDLGPGAYESWHNENRKKAACQTPERYNNDGTTIAGRSRDGQSRQRPQQRSSPMTTATKAQITKSVALLLFAELGMGDAPKWGLKTLGKNLNNLHKLEGVKEKVTNPDLQDVMGDVLNTLNAGDVIEVTDDEDGAAPPAMSPKKKGKKTVTTATKAKTAKGKNKGKAETNGHAGKNGASVKLDKFGSPVGSNNAKVNAILGKKPLSFGEIVAKSGLTRGQVRYAHLDALVAKGVAVRSKEGWALK